MATATATDEKARDYVEVDLMVVYSENHTTVQHVRLPRELDALGPRDARVQQALLATVAPQVGADIGFAFRAEDVQAVRWTPECAPGVAVSEHVRAQHGKLHLLLMNAPRGAVARLHHMADAVAGLSRQLQEKDAEIERLKARVAELEALRDHLAASLPKQQ